MNVCSPTAKKSLKMCPHCEHFPNQKPIAGHFYCSRGGPQTTDASTSAKPRTAPAILTNVHASVGSTVAMAVPRDGTC